MTKLIIICPFMIYEHFNPELSPAFTKDNISDEYESPLKLHILGK